MNSQKKKRAALNLPEIAKCKGCGKIDCEWDVECVPRIKKRISKYPDGHVEKKKWEELLLAAPFV